VGTMMEMWQSILIAVISSLLGGGGIAWVFLKLFVKDIAREVFEKKFVIVEKNFRDTLDVYTTKEQMQIERKDLLEEVRKQYLSIMAFKEVEKSFEENFKTIDRRLSDNSKRFDKLDASLEHIKDLIIQKK
jgi:hypothetical protein